MGAGGASRVYLDSDFRPPTVALLDDRVLRFRSGEAGSGGGGGGQHGKRRDGCQPPRANRYGRGWRSFVLVVVEEAVGEFDVPRSVGLPGRGAARVGPWSKLEALPPNP